MLYLLLKLPVFFQSRNTNQLTYVQEHVDCYHQVVVHVVYIACPLPIRNCKLKMFRLKLNFLFALSLHMFNESGDRGGKRITVSTVLTHNFRSQTELEIICRLLRREICVCGGGSIRKWRLNWLCVLLWQKPLAKEAQI